MNFDCGFTTDNNWFRYRAAAIIVEEEYVLLAGIANADYFYSVGGAVHMNETAENAVYVTTEADNDSKLAATFTFEYYKTY